MYKILNLLVQKMATTYLSFLLLSYLLPAPKAQVALKEVEGKDIFTSCKKDWVAFGDKCYGLGTKKGIDKLNWYQAKQRCEELSGKLATVYSQELMDFLLHYIVLDVQASMWIGLHDTRNESRYEWVDGTPFDFTYWEQHEPNPIYTDSEDCVEITFRFPNPDSVLGGWNDYNCNGDPLEALCQKKIDKKEAKKKKNRPDPRFCAPPDGGWRYGKSCYHIVMEELSWSEAENYCIQNHGGHLATIRHFTVHFFLKYILRNYTKDMWIGIKVRDAFSQQWSSGWFLSYAVWMKNNETFIENTCAARSVSGEWKKENCENAKPFICEKSTDKPLSLKSNEQLVCPEEPDDWIDIGGEYCYHIEPVHSESWYKANFICMRRGGVLASFHSKLEVEILKQFFPPTRNIYWIGLYRHRQHDDEFVWVDGTPLDYKAWKINEPNSIKEQCVEFFADSMTWNDQSCDIGRDYICSTKKIASNRTVIEKVLPPPVCHRNLSNYSVLGVTVCIVTVAVLLGVIVYHLRMDKTELTFPIHARDSRHKYRSKPELIINEDS